MGSETKYVSIVQKNLEDGSTEINKAKMVVLYSERESVANFTISIPRKVIRKDGITTGEMDFAVRIGEKIPTSVEIYFEE